MKGRTPRSDKDKDPVASVFMQESQGALGETSDVEQKKHERQSPQEEETKRESNVEEEHDEKSRLTVCSLEW